MCMEYIFLFEAEKARMFCIASLKFFYKANHFEMPTDLPFVPAVVYSFQKYIIFS